MKMKRIVLIILTVIASMLLYKVYAQEHYFQIINAYEDYGSILEEWKSPGKYSPINIFDNDVQTCFAIKGDDSGNSFILRFQLEEPITCDRMEILGGVALNDDLFAKNNRPRKTTIWLCATDEDFMKDNMLYDKTVILEDKREYQTIEFDRAYTFKRFTLQVLDVYRGTVYNDTCVTELKLYHNGKELKPKDIEKMRKVYIQRIGERLKGYLKPGAYDVSEGLCEAIIDSKGNIKLRNFNGLKYDLEWYKSTQKLLKRLIVKDSRLYVLYGGKEYLTEYRLAFYSERPIPSTPTCLSMYNIGGIKDNNMQLLSKEMMEKRDKYIDSILKSDEKK